MDAAEQALVAELVEILADRLRRDVETAREILNRDAPRLAGEVDDGLLARNQHELAAGFEAKMKRNPLEDKSVRTATSVLRSPQQCVPERPFDGDREVVVQVGKRLRAALVDTAIADIDRDHLVAIVEERRT